MTAVRDLDLRIEPGEVVAFLGPNGAGKTTTIDMLLGLSRPTSGTVEVFGRTPADAIAEGRIAAVLQTGGLLKDLTVARDGRDDRGASSRTPGRSTRCSNGPGSPTSPAARWASAPAASSSGCGSRMALLPDPDLMVLDEPTTGMDVEGRRDFWNAIRADAQAGRTILFATHYLEEADAYADRIVLVRKGRVVADGTAAEIKALAAGRVVRATLPGADQVELAALPGVDTAEVRGDSVLLHAKRLRRRGPLPAHRTRPRGTWRSPRATSRTRSSP